MSLQIGTYTFEDIAATGATLAQAATGEDTLTIDLARPLDAADLFTPYAPYTFRDGTDYSQTFWLDLRAAAATPAETRSLHFVSAFRFLDLANYTQERPVVTPDTDPQVIAMQAVMLGQSATILTPGGPVTIDKIDARAQLAHIVTQFQARFGAIWSGTDTMPELKLPWLPKTNATLGTAIMALLAWFPGLAIRSDGGGLKLVDTYTQASHAISEALPDLASITIKPRHDLLVSKTKLIYAQPGPRNESGGNGIGEILIDEATTANGSPRWIERTVELESEEPFPSLGLAEQFQTWVGQLILDTQITLHALHWEILPGHRLDLAGAIATPASGAASPVVQTLTRDLFAGTCTIQAGPRDHLSLDQLLDLNRKQPKGGGGGGGEPDPDETGTLATIMMGLPAGAQAHWSIGPYSGTGSDNITDAAPGTYTAIFAPVWDSDGGRLYMAPPEGPKTLVSGGSATFTANYEAISRLKLQAAGQSPSTDDIDINTEDLASHGPATLTEIDVCVDGQPKKRLFLCSEPYDPV